MGYYHSESLMLFNLASFLMKCIETLLTFWETTFCVWRKESNINNACILKRFSGIAYFIGGVL